MTCECSLESKDHRPGECPVPAEWNVLRNGVRLNLCGDCTFPEDIDRHRISGTERTED